MPDNRQETRQLAKRWYNSKRWRDKRLAQLRKQPCCQMCDTHGRTSPATIADHVEPHRGNEYKFWNGKLQSLCKPCHDGAKQAFESTGKVRGCDADGIPFAQQNVASPQQCDQNQQKVTQNVI